MEYRYSSGSSTCSSSRLAAADSGHYTSAREYSSSQASSPPYQPHSTGQHSPWHEKEASVMKSRHRSNNKSLETHRGRRFSEKENHVVGLPRSLVSMMPDKEPVVL